MVSNFLFHRVNPQRDLLWDPMDVALFDKCVQFISMNFYVVQLEKIFNSDFRFNPKKSYATIVFDDGYKDNIEHALPILEKYKVKASFYVVTDCIENNIPTWTYNLDYAFQKTDKNKIDLDIDFLPLELRTKNLPNQRARIAYVKKLKPVLKKLSHEERTTLITIVKDSFNDVELPQLMMNWQDLRQLRDLGHYIGSHTVTHSMLGTMSDEESIKIELKESGEKIRQQLGYFPTTISYPVGSYNESTIRLCKESGYKIGLAVKQKPHDPVNDNCFEVPRIEIYNEPWIKTRLRILNVIGTLSRLLNRV